MTANSHLCEIVRHVMPDDSDAMDADTSWFDRQNDFEREELKHLVAYKRNTLHIAADGVFSKKPQYSYPHILPEGSLRQAFYEPLSDKIITYLAAEGIQQHSELLNLKSSQAACLNLLFPLRLDPALATAVMRPFLRDLDTVTSVEFEYTAQDEAKGEYGCTAWLGEPPGGKRGQNRTSIDAAIFWRNKQGRQCATLIEWKYTEHSFGGCSAYDKAKSDTKKQCFGETFARNCQLTSGAPHRSRHYWDHLAAAGISMEKLRCVAGCPFRGPFYQLMRQFLVARYMLEAKIAEYTEVVVVHFRGNTALKTVPGELAPLASTNVLDAWNSILSGVPLIRGIDAEDIMAAYDTVIGIDAGWRIFVRQHYRI